WRGTYSILLFQSSLRAASLATVGIAQHRAEHQRCCPGCGLGLGLGLGNGGERAAQPAQRSWYVRQPADGGLVIRGLSARAAGASHERLLRQTAACCNGGMSE